MRKKIGSFLFVLILGIIGVFIFAQNQSYSQIPPALTYAPNFWFDSEEKYFPTNPLKFYFKDGQELPSQIAVKRYKNLSLEEKIKDFEVFYIVKDNNNEWVYQYWIFYVFNDFENEHYGDWESVFVFVDKDNKKINKVVGSAQGMMNNELAVSNDIKNIWVYIGKGSHANCPDKIPDGRCDFKWWKYREGKNWNQEDIQNGFKISYTEYPLTEINEDFIKNFKNKKSFEKSPSLGSRINISKILPTEKNIYIPLFGNPPVHPWYKPEYENPEKIRPFTGELVKEKAKKFVGNVVNTANKVVQNIGWVIQKTVEKVNLFQAAVVSPLPAPKETIGQELGKKVGQNSLESELESEESKTKTELESKPKSNLIEIQEQLDNISESIDVFNQQVEELVENKPQQEFIEKEKHEKNDEEIEKPEELEKEREITDLEENNQENKNEEATILCEKNGQPVRNEVIFNEIAWMGTTNSANNEWIELKNISEKEIDLSGWQILDEANQIKIIFEGHRLPSNSFFLLERTDDDSVSEVAADLIYTGALGNTNEILYLFDEDCQLQDKVVALPDWPAGDNSSKRTMERKSDLSWQTSQNPGGTPKIENSSGYIVQYAGGGGGGVTYSPSEEEQKEEPKITFSYPKENPVDKEIEVELSVSGFKEALYDVKISIQDGTATLSEIYNEKENKWQSSYNYLKKVFTGPSFEGKFKLKIKEEENEFQGQADFLVRIREDGKSKYEESTDKIKIIEPENRLPVAFFNFSPQAPSIGAEILFDASNSTDSDGEITGYIWGFGDTNISTTSEATTTHFYSTSSDFPVSLTVVDDNNATSSTTKTITISFPENPNLDVVINEIAWMGTKSSKSDEWIEFYNNTNSTINIANWSIFEADTGKCLNFSEADGTTTTSISPKGYLIYANHQDDLKDDQGNSLVDIWDATIGLNNTSPGQIILYNSPNCQGEIVDIVNQITGNWFAGTTNPAFITMERISATSSGATSANWANNNLITRNGKDVAGNNINGTPKAENSVSVSETEISTINQLPFDEFDELNLTYLGNPYIFKYYLQVPAGKVLNVEPWAILKFDSN